jgi:hypothetical protein
VKKSLFKSNVAAHGQVLLVEEKGKEEKDTDIRKRGLKW